MRYELYTYRKYLDGFCILFKNAQFIFTSVSRFQAFSILSLNLDTFVSKLVSFEGTSFAICTSMSSRFMNILFHHISICLFTELSLQCLLNFFFHERSPFKYSIFPDRKTSLCVKFSVICVDTKKYRSIRLPQLTTVLTL